MSLRFVIGGPRSGKTSWCLDRARELDSADPAGPPVILLVPEQASYQTEQAYLSGTVEGTTRVRVLSFARLAIWVHSMSPVPARPRLTDVHRRMLAASVVARLRREEDAGALLRVRGIESGVADFLAEMRQFQISASYLRGLAGETAGQNGRLARKLGILARAAEAYEERVHGRFEDPDDSLAALRDTIAGTGDLAGARVFVDSFYGFTAIELEVVRGLMRRCREVAVSLTIEPGRYHAVRSGEKPMETARTFLVEETLRQLLSMALEEDIPIADPVELPAGGSAAPRFRARALGFLAERFHAPGRQEPYAAEAPELSFEEVADDRDQARRACEQLLAWRERHGWRWDEMAILARDLEAHAQPLAEHLDSVRIPHFLDRHEPLETHPAVQGTLAALEAVLHDWNPRAILEFAKSGLHALDPDEVALLEDYVASWPHAGPRWRDPTPWKPPPPRSPFEDEGTPRPETAPMDRIDAIRMAIVAPLEAFAQRLEEARREEGYSVPGFVTAVCELIRQGIPEPEEDRLAVLHEAGEMFDALVQAAADEPFTADVLLGLMRDTFGRLTLPRIPPELNRVLVGQAGRTRLPAVRGVVVIGLAEGEFPRPGSNASLLTDRERDLVHRVVGESAGPIPPFRASARRLFLREAFFAWMAFTRASEALTLIRPLTGQTGDRLSPSPYWESLRRLFPRNGAAVPGPALSFERAVRGREAAAVVCRDVFNPGPGAVPPQAVGTELARRLPLAERQGFHRVLAFASRRNEAGLDPELARSFFGETFRSSVSALESYARCPFQYFMGSMIRPEVSTGPRATPADTGNLAHATLKAVADGLLQEGRSFSNLGADEIEPLTTLAFQEPLERLRRAGLFESASERLAAELLLGQLVDTVRFLADSGRQMNARVILTEQRFGGRGVLEAPVLTVETPHGPFELALRGQIDRIDLVRDTTGETWLAVFDYKLTGRKVDWPQAADGMSLQLPVYLLVLERNVHRLAQMEGLDELPLAGAFYLPIVEKADARRAFRGVTSVTAYERLGLGEHSLLPGSVKAADKTQTAGDVVADSQFAALTGQAEKHVKRLASAILDGGVAVRPALHRRNTPCATCDFAEACRLDFSMNSRRTVPNLTRPEAIDAWLGPPRPENC